MLRSRQKRATGIHFDDRGLYAVELARARGRTVLAGSARVDLEVSAGVDRSTGSSLRTGFTAALKKARGHRGMRFENPYATLQSGAVQLKQRPPFFVGNAKRRGQLEWEARQFLPDDLRSYALDCFTTTRAVFVVAARREGIEEVTAICRGAGIPRPRVDAAPLALCNAAESSGASAPVGIDLVLDFAGDRATMILLDRGEVAAVEFCSWDGRYAPYAQGAVDIQEDGEAAAAAADPARGEQLSRSLRRLMDLELGGENPDRVWLSGREALDGWPQEVETRLSLGSRTLNPFADVDTAGAEEVADPFAFATAAGLAFRGLSEA